MATGRVQIAVEDGAILHIGEARVRQGVHGAEQRRCTLNLAVQQGHHSQSGEVDDQTRLVPHLPPDR